MTQPKPKTRPRPRKRTCSACPRRLRLGKGRRALIIDKHGGIEPGVICIRCAARGIFVVNAAPLTVAPLCMCGKERASVGSECHERLTETIRELTKTNIALQRALEKALP